MSKGVRSMRYKPLSQSKIEDILKNNPNQLVEHEHVEPKPVLGGCIDYDTKHPDEVLKDFCANIRDMLAQYEYDKDRLNEMENQMQDILHYIELTGDKNANTGYKLYKRLTNIRRERRACKNEIDLLQPVYDAFKDTGLMSRLTDLLGKCRSNKQFIDSRGYAIRTDVLKDL